LCNLERIVAYVHGGVEALPAPPLRPRGRRRLARRVLPLVLVGGLLLTPGCATPPSSAAPGPKTIVGAVGGTAAGGLLGSKLSHGNPAMTFASALLAGLIGAGVGSLLDQQDRPVILQQATPRAATAPPGTAIPWSNPQTGHRGVVVPGDWRMSDEGPCRQCTITTVSEGRFADVEACAVRRADGSWGLVQRR